MFGRLQPARADRLRSLPAIRQLGIDPVTERLTPSLLRQALGTSRQPIKVALLDQSRIAGLGNIHAAEALFRARIHPARKPQTLKPPEWTRLCRSIHQAIRFALDRENGEDIEYVEEPGTENPFLIYGRAGEKCRRCGTPIRSFVQAGRTTYFCSKDQPRRSSA
jgi:formamidopyrimidine-DNA glycosylase